MRVVKGSSKGQSVSNWATLAGGTRRVRSLSTTATGASTAGCKSAWRWGCAATVRTILRICTKVCGVLSFVFLVLGTLILSWWPEQGVIHTMSGAYTNEVTDSGLVLMTSWTFGLPCC